MASIFLSLQATFDINLLHNYQKGGYNNLLMGYNNINCIFMYYTYFLGKLFYLHIYRNTLFHSIFMSVGILSWSCGVQSSALSASALKLHYKTDTCAVDEYASLGIS